jgi:cysteine-rich repeat protein
MQHRLRHRLLLAAALLVVLAPPAHATGLTLARTASGVDWVSAGIGGISGDTADIALTGVTGPVSKAYLYWDGMAIAAMDQTYDNDTIAINGNPITGTTLGSTSPNCWGQGESRAFVADVTAYVTGDGTYALSGLMAQPTHQPNGASLVVLFDDGNASNDHDLIFFEGNDGTSLNGYGGVEDRGWHALLDGIVYHSGPVSVQFHVADGQSTADTDATFHEATHSHTIDEAAGLWDGTSVPLAGTSRSPGDALWDIHTVDISDIFTHQGTYQLYLDSGSQPMDCIALVVLIVDLGATPGPPVQVCGDGFLTAPEQCDDGNLADGDCCDHSCRFEPAGLVCGNAGDPCLESRCDGAGLCDAEGRSCRMPVTPGAGMLALRHGKQDRLTWHWTTGTSTVAEFGDPFGATDYDLCLYDKGTGSLRLLSRTSVSAGGTCGAMPCWVTTSGGYDYRNHAGPLEELALQGSRFPGHAQIMARAIGSGFTMPAMPLAPPVMVRLRARSGLCWGANYSVPETNRRRRFMSYGDYSYP